MKRHSFPIMFPPPASSSLQSPHQHFREQRPASKMSPLLARPKESPPHLVGGDAKGERRRWRRRTTTSRQEEGGPRGMGDEGSAGDEGQRRNDNVRMMRFEVTRAKIPKCSLSRRVYSLVRLLGCYKKEELISVRTYYTS